VREVSTGEAQADQRVRELQRSVAALNMKHVRWMEPTSIASDNGAAIGKFFPGTDSGYAIQGASFGGSLDKLRRGGCRRICIATHERVIK
jgi:hypothetical protein